MIELHPIHVPEIDSAAVLATIVCGVDARPQFSPRPEPESSSPA